MNSKKPKVVVVDDEEHILDIIDFSLKDDFEVETFSNSRVALEHLRDAMPQILITDINMPDIDGREVIVRTKSLCAETVVMVITGRECQPEEVRDLQKLGAKIVLPKPLPTGQELRQILAGVL